MPSEAAAYKAVDVPPPWEDTSGREAVQDKVPQDKYGQDKDGQDKDGLDKAADRAEAPVDQGEGGSGAGRWVLPSLCSVLELLLQVLRLFSRRRGR